MFDSGYYWESHETWEEIWAALGRSGDDADCVRALIKLAAAGVKARQRQPHGVRIHAERALALLTRVAATAGPTIGFDFARLIDLARWIANEADRIAALEAKPPEPIFPVRLATIALVRPSSAGLPAIGPE